MDYKDKIYCSPINDKHPTFEQSVPGEKTLLIYKDIEQLDHIKQQLHFGIYLHSNTQVPENLELIFRLHPAYSNF